MTTQVLSVTETARKFSDVINRVYYQGYTYDLTRGGVVVARLSQAEKRITCADLAQQWNFLPLLSPQDGDEWLAEFDELKQNEPRIGNGVWDT